MHLVKKKSLKHIVPFVYLIRGQFVIYIYILTSNYVLFSIFDEFRPKAECLRIAETHNQLQTPWKARTPAPTLERFEAVWIGMEICWKCHFYQNIPLKHKNYRNIYDNKSNVSILLTIPLPSNIYIISLSPNPSVKINFQYCGWKCRKNFQYLLFACKEVTDGKKL